MQFLAVSQSEKYSEALSYVPRRVRSRFHSQTGGWSHHHLLSCAFEKGSCLPSQSNLDLQELLKCWNGLSWCFQKMVYAQKTTRWIWTELTSSFGCVGTFHPVNDSLRQIHKPSQDPDPFLTAAALSTVYELLYTFQAICAIQPARSVTFLSLLLLESFSSWQNSKKAQI